MIFVCGDTHHTIDINKLEQNKWPEGYKLTKNDYLIVLGDFGLIWYGKRNSRELESIDWYNNKPWTTLFIDGNHENFDRLFSNEFPKIEKFESIVKKISDSIFYLQRGHVYTIENKTFFIFGGGNSIDKNARTAHISWWAQEIPNYKEMDFAISNLERIKNSVDFIFTHTCSNNIFMELSKIMDLIFKQDSEENLRSFFDWIEKNIQFKQWHFGHFHSDIHLGKYLLHYNNKPMRIV